MDSDGPTRFTGLEIDGEAGVAVRREGARRIVVLGAGDRGGGQTGEGFFIALLEGVFSGGGCFAGEGA